MAMRKIRSEDFWKFLIAVAIMTAAGPEIAAGLEMLTLLELLGATLFTTAFIAGAKLVLLELRTRISDMFLLPAQLAVLRSDARVSQKRTAIACLLAYWEWWMSVVVVVGIALVHAA
jgi:hypothetical protein